MSKRSLLKFLKPSKWLGGVRRRGWKGAALHALRRGGTVAERAWVGPASIRINPMGAVCNHACPMCWLQQTPPEQLAEFKRIDREQGLKLADYETLFRSMPPGLEEVNVVGGGEPLAHPEALGILEAIKTHGWRGTLITNGTLLRESVARRLIEIGWDQVRVSVHAGDRETYRAVQGVDHYDTLLTNLATLNTLRREAGAAGPRLVVFHVIQRANAGAVDRLLAMAEHVGADEVVLEKLIVLDPEQRLTAEELSSAVHALERLDRPFPFQWNRAAIVEQLRSELTLLAPSPGPFRPAARCSVGFDQAYINSMGDVLPCCFSDEVMGNLRQQSFREIWYGEPYRAFRRRLIAGRFARYCITNRCAMKDVLHD